MAVGIFMEYGDLLIQFPVNPEEIKINQDGNNEKTEVVKLGEVNIARDMKLASIEFQCFLPATNSYPFILNRNQFEAPEFYIDFINKVRKDKKPIRFIVSDKNINILAIIENFSYSYKAGDDDVYYNISLSEYREIRVKTVQIADYENKRPQKVDPPPKPVSVNKQVTPGCRVLVNGRLHRDSYGSGPGMTLTNYTGKVNFVKTDGRSHPYHVTNLSDGWMGWVLSSAVKVL
ncbi:MAG: hypothetical protein RR620_12985 [Clostridium sp.]